MAEVLARVSYYRLGAPNGDALPNPPLGAPKPGDGDPNPAAGLGAPKGDGDDECAKVPKPPDAPNPDVAVPAPKV